jgi:hypothetical protein
MAGENVTNQKPGEEADAPASAIQNNPERESRFQAVQSAF